MKIGITGGAGYIASHIVQDLLEYGHELVLLDNFVTGNPENLPNSTAVTFIEGDVGSEAALNSFFSHPMDTVFHFAALKAAGESMTDPVKYSANNVRGTFHLVETMVQAGVKNLVFSSSAAVYGTPEYIPIDEDHPRKPINYYGFTKLMMEQNLEWMAELAGLRFASLRYFNAAGYDVRGRVQGLENKPQNLLPVVMEVACGMRPSMQLFGRDYETRDGTCIRDYIHTNDLSRAHILAMEYLKKEARSLTVNLGSEEGLTVQEIIDEARKVTGVQIKVEDAPRRPGDPASLIASARKAHELLGWKAEHSDANTLVKSMWSVYQKHSPEASHQ
ncbi:MAG: UDP-glucose 4-epimerase GalE [Spirochaetaceae bacterium]|nr:UDP-glucose 4-epimerase GalE [Spirochaetaceae bacterium]|tara:strand:- start:19134 stop:20129 length:996 start_codon:yes stop_codon:yes gene_type:complete